jgi:hypothetical protein
MRSKRQESSTRTSRFFLIVVCLLCATSLSPVVLGDAGPAEAPSSRLDAYQPLDVQPAEVHLDPSSATFTCRQVLTVNVRKVQHLVGFMYRVTFDPDALEVADVDPDRPGVQIEQGDVFEGRSYLEQTNSVDNATGVITLAAALMGQGNVSSLSASLGRITFRSKGSGASAVEFGDQIGQCELARDVSVEPYDPEIPTTWYSATLTVIGECTGLFLPLVMNEYG